MCIYVLKEIIDCYRARNGPVYMCFLDASKAFDRVNHDILFRKLVTRGVAGYIIRILLHWYTNQTMFVKWGNALTQPFSVSNGVRQGGVLSPFLLNVYMDDLSSILNWQQTGCTIGDTVINHLMYADDLVLISSSASGLQKLINECSTYGSAHDIKYNCNKSAILVVRSSYIMHVALSSFSISHDLINEVDHVKYLGHIITSNASDDMDILRQCRSLYIQCNVLVRKK